MTEKANPDSYGIYQELTDIANHLAEIADALDSTNRLRAAELSQIAHHVAALRGVSNGPSRQGWTLAEDGNPKCFNETHVTGGLAKTGFKHCFIALERGDFYEYEVSVPPLHDATKEQP